EKAYNDGDKTVILSDEELDSLPAEDNDQIDVVQFVPDEQVDPILFGTSYFLEPVGRSPKSYVLLRRTLEETERTAIVTFTLRTKTRLGVLRVHDDLMVLQTMRWPKDLREVDFAPSGKKSEPKAKEVEMAGALVAQFSDDFDPEQFTDEYQEQLRTLLDEKLEKGETVDTAATFGEEREQQKEREAEGGKVLSLMDALERSVTKRRGSATDSDKEGSGSEKSSGSQQSSGSTKSSDSKKSGSSGGSAKSSSSESGSSKSSSTSGSKSGSSKGGSKSGGTKKSGGSKKSDTSKKSSSSKQGKKSAGSGRQGQAPGRPPDLPGDIPVAQARQSLKGMGMSSTPPASARPQRPRTDGMRARQKLSRTDRERRRSRRARTGLASGLALAVLFGAAAAPARRAPPTPALRARHPRAHRDRSQPPGTVPRRSRRPPLGGRADLVPGRPRTRVRPRPVPRLGDRRRAGGAAGSATVRAGAVPGRRHPCPCRRPTGGRTLPGARAPVRPPRLPRGEPGLVRGTGLPRLCRDLPGSAGQRRPHRAARRPGAR